MKNFLFLLVIFFLNETAHAQYCASNPVNCPITYNLTTAGFENYNTFPCVVKNQNYNHTFELYVPNYITYSGILVQIDSIAIDAIDNLPCGLCWNSSKVSNTFAGNSHNCIAFSGLTNDRIGTYKLSLTGTAFTNYGPLYGQLDYTGFQIFLNVINQGGNCNPADTANSIQACQNGSCKIPGVEFVELSSKSACYQGGDTVIVGINKTFVDYQWNITNRYTNNTVFYNTSTVSILYDNVDGSLIEFSGIDSNGCTFSTDSHIFLQNIVNALGLIQAPKICSINLDTSIVNGQYSLTLQSSNFTSHSIDTIAIATEVLINSTSYPISTQNVLPGVPYPVLQLPFLDSIALKFYYKSAQCSQNYNAFYGNVLGNQLYSDGNGYPVLSVRIPTFGGIYAVDSFEVYRRGNGSGWQFFRKYFNTTPILIGDNAPFSTNMEYMVVCYPNSDCNPNRANNSNIIFKQAIQVAPALVVNSIEEKQIDHIEIYPNPTLNTIELKGDISGLDINILNCLGQKQQLLMKGNKIDLSSCEQGVYYVTLSNAATTKTFRVIKL